MKNTSYFTILIFSISILSCNRPTENNSVESPEIEHSEGEEEVFIGDSHNSMNSLDWNGTYKGILPCADCEGIETSLTLNPDLTYVLFTNYLGRNDALEEEKKGTFTWDEKGSIISLGNITSGPNQYKIGENRIWHLDMNGQMITGDLANHYILTKLP